MNVANRSCPHCGASLSPAQALCANCGEPYGEPVGLDGERTVLAQSPSSYGMPSSNGTSAVYQGQSSTPPPSNVEYTPDSAPAEEATSDEYKQQPSVQGGDVQTPQPKRRSTGGLFIGISGLVVMLLLIGTGFFLFAKSKGNIAHSVANSPTPAVMAATLFWAVRIRQSRSGNQSKRKR